MHTNDHGETVLTPNSVMLAPVALAQGVEAELVGDLCRVHGVGQILLVGEHQQHGVAQLVLRAGISMRSMRLTCAPGACIQTLSDPDVHTIDQPQ